MATNMKNILKTAAVVLLVFCLCFAVGCRSKEYIAEYSNDMPELPSKSQGTSSDGSASGSEEIGEDNVVDIEDLLNPNKEKGESSENQGGSSSKPSTSSSSSSGASSTTSSKPSSSNSSQSTSSSKPSSSQSTTSVENDMAAGAETDKVPYDTPGWLL